MVNAGRSAMEDLRSRVSFGYGARKYGRRPGGDPVQKGRSRTCFGSTAADLGQLRLTLNQEKTRDVHVPHGFEFLGFKFKRWIRRRQFKPVSTTIGHQIQALSATVYDIPTPVDRAIGLMARDLDDGIDQGDNPMVRGWGNYFWPGAHVRKVFQQLDGYAAARCARWLRHNAKSMEERELEALSDETACGASSSSLIGLVSLIPSLQAAQAHP